MSKLAGLIISGLFLFLLFSAGCTDFESGDEEIKTGLQAEVPAEYALMQKNLEYIKSGVNSGLESIKGDLKAGAAAVSEYGYSSPEAEKLISAYLVKYPFSQCSVVIDKNGVVLSAFPDTCKKLVGLDLSTQGVVVEALNDQTPILSDFFLMEKEEFWAVFQSYPVFDKDESYPGFIDMTYKPQDFLGRYIKPVTDSTDLDVWVVQTDGTVIYDTTPEEIGLNLFTDPSYLRADLQLLFREIVQSETGTGEYIFWDKEWANPVGKYAVWDTAGIDGTEWRIVVTRNKESNGSGISGNTTWQKTNISAKYEDLKEFVHSAVEFEHRVGSESALAEFNSLQGSFIDDEKYIFAYNMNGTVLALPFQQALLGRDRSETTDSNGVDFIRGLVSVAENGGGSIYYIYTNPAHDYRKELKLSYVEPVDDYWFVGSGIYIPDVPVNFSREDIEELVLRVKSARQYARENNKLVAISEFNNISGEFAKGSSYIFAYGMDGTTLALPYQPELIGTNRLNFTDIYGVPVMKLEINGARNGGGFVYVEYLDPDYNESRFKLCYVLPVDDYWFVGSGIYTESI